MSWASSFIACAYCLISKIRSLIFAPLVYSVVPTEVFVSCTDNLSDLLYIYHPHKRWMGFMLLYIKKINECFFEKEWET